MTDLELAATIKRLGFLVSDAKINPDEPVNLRVELARTINSQTEHIVFVSRSTFRHTAQIAYEYARDGWQFVRRLATNRA